MPQLAEELPAVFEALDAGQAVDVAGIEDEAVRSGLFALFTALGLDMVRELRRRMR